VGAAADGEIEVVLARAKLTAAMTSPALAGRTTAAGRRSIIAL
jgi:hypothetical protein